MVKLEDCVEHLNLDPLNFLKVIESTSSQIISNLVRGGSDDDVLRGQIREISSLLMKVSNNRLAVNSNGQISLTDATEW